MSQCISRPKYLHRSHMDQMDTDPTATISISTKSSIVMRPQIKQRTLTAHRDRTWRWQAPITTHRDPSLAFGVDPGQQTTHSIRWVSVIQLQTLVQGSGFLEELECVGKHAMFGAVIWLLLIFAHLLGVFMSDPRLVSMDTGMYLQMTFWVLDYDYARLHAKMEEPAIHQVHAHAISNTSGTIVKRSSNVCSSNSDEQCEYVFL